MNKNIYALSIGAFAFGMAEFVIMGILPDIAEGLIINISRAGNLIAAYAFGVCIGGPILIGITRNLRVKLTLKILMAVFTLGSIVTAISTNYDFAILGRFISGVPHGAFFGVAGNAR